MKKYFGSEGKRKVFNFILQNFNCLKCETNSIIEYRKKNVNDFFCIIFYS